MKKEKKVQTAPDRPSEPAYYIVNCRISKFQHRMVQPKDVRNLNGLCFRSFSKKVSFVQISLQKMKKEKNSWEVRHLVHESFVSLAQQSSVLYYRLSDLQPKDVRNLNGLCFRSISKKVSFVQISLQKMKKEKKCTNGTG